jgi:NADH-quinone oxidoreductase subunit C
MNPTPDPKNNGTPEAKPAAAAPERSMAPVTTPAERPQVVPVTKPAPAAPAAAPAAPAPPPRPNPLPHLSTPFQGVDEVLRGYHAEAKVAPDAVVTVATELDREGLSLDTITGVDWMAEGQMEVVYDFFHPLKNLRVVVRTRVPRDNPELPTISGVFPGANWHERETHDFFGIRFSGHPDLSPFLLPEDADYHPLRKDFVS